jgi:hypothetical protein
MPRRNAAYRPPGSSLVLDEVRESSNLELPAFLRRENSQSAVRRRIFRAGSRTESAPYPRLR